MSLRTRKIASISKSNDSTVSANGVLTGQSTSLEEDPAHLEFVASLEGLVENARVVDFVPGVF